MAYKINRKDEHVVMPDGLTTVRDVQKFAMQKGTPEFYELEPAEVISVILDEEDFSSEDKPSTLLENGKPDWSFYGAIRARMAMSSNSENDISIIKPLDTNMNRFTNKKLIITERIDLGDTVIG